MINTVHINDVEATNFSDTQRRSIPADIEVVGQVYLPNTTEAFTYRGRLRVDEAAALRQLLARVEERIMAQFAAGLMGDR